MQTKRSVGLIVRRLIVFCRIELDFDARYGYGWMRRLMSNRL